MRLIDCYHPHFTDGETEAQGGYVTCSRSYSSYVAELGWDPSCLAQSLGSQGWHHLHRDGSVPGCHNSGLFDSSHCGCFQVSGHGRRTQVGQSGVFSDRLCQMTLTKSGARQMKESLLGEASALLHMAL